MTGYVDVCQSEYSLAMAVANVGPISAGINVDHRSFWVYKLASNFMHFTYSIYS